MSGSPNRPINYGAEDGSADKEGRGQRSEDKYKVLRSIEPG